MNIRHRQPDLLEKGILTRQGPDLGGKWQAVQE